MLRRLRRLQLSLATKCQLLFGIAAGIIILAALLVTWQRIEQLTLQQDTVSAELLAKQVLAQHLATGRLPPDDPPYDFYDGMTVRRPRIVATHDETALTPFEQRAISRFRRDRATFFEPYQTPDGREGLLLAAPVRLHADCLSCHSPPGPDGVLGVPRQVPLPLAPMPDGNLDPADEQPADPGQPIGVLPPPGQATQTDPELVGLVSVDVPSQILTRQRLLNRVFLITASLLAAATATVTLYFILTRLILHPVRVLQETAEKVRAGDLSVRSSIATGDEFQTLSETINAMLNVLQERNEQLRRAKQSLDAKLDQLAATNIALDESNRLKSEFLASVSHELRTPLNSILGFADLLRDSERDNPRIVRYANNISRSGSALLDLINDLLDLAKIEAGRLELRPDRLSVSDMFEALVTLLGPLAAKRRVTIHSRIVPHVPVITTDPGKLQQILYNLLSNAIKFSPEGGRVDLEARREDAGHIRISVTDNGPGIAPDDRQRVFEKFRQLDSGHTRQHTGTGLGLAISRELADLLGGRLGVDSVPGHGATFWLILPLDLPAEEPRRTVRGE